MKKTLQLLDLPFRKIASEIGNNTYDLQIDFAKANGGIEYAEQRMQVYHDKAVEVLMTLPESEAREGLLLLADYIVERRK